MKCVIHLSGNDDEIEIVTDLDDESISKLNQYMNEEEISSDILVKLIVRNFIEYDEFCQNKVRDGVVLNV